MRKTFSIKVLVGTQVDSYSANIEREELFGLISKKEAGEVVEIPLGSGTSYLDGVEYSDNAVLTLFPTTSILSIVEHNLEEKKAVALKTE
jgi:hypothetical protein